MDMIKKRTINEKMVRETLLSVLEKLQDEQKAGLRNQQLTTQINLAGPYWK